nr:DUF975 family protein [Clostridia bacterium]
MPHIVPAFEFRRRARLAMKPVMSVLVVVMLIAMLPSLGSSVITMMTGGDLTAVIEPFYTQEGLAAMMDADAAATDQLMANLAAFLSEKWPFIALTSAITLLLGPALTLGFDHTLLKALRKEEIAYSTVLARLPIFFKAIGLTLMIALRVFLWMLPGWGVSLLGAVLLVFEPTLGVLVMVAAMALMFVLMIRAMYRYRLATYVMADMPETGINAAIRRSKEIMKGRKMELFSLELSFIGWRLLVSFGQTLLLGMLGGVLGAALGMFAAFLLQMYMYMATAAFYQEYGVSPVNFPHQAQEELL